MELSIAVWNINGITHKPDQSNVMFKTDDPSFLNYVKKHDILGILETKVGPNEKIHINGYKTVQINRKKSKINRYFGGLCIAIKENIAKGVSVLNTKNESEFVWIKLDKGFFKICQDYYVCFVYVSPDKTGREFGIDVFDRVTNELALYSTKGHCIIMGDMNAHTQVEHDFIINDQNTQELNLPSDYMVDIPMNRRNCDTSKLNEHGRALLDLCIASGFRILNGRKIGDLFGDCTYFGPMCKNPTLIDYGLVHTDNFNDITIFSVQDLCYLSDHCLIYLQISVNPMMQNSPSQNHTKLENLPSRYIWEEDKEKIFLSHLTDLQNRGKISEVLKNHTENTPIEIDCLTESVNSIIINAADKTFCKTKTVPSRKGGKQKYAKHFDTDCTKLLKDLKNMSRKLSRNPKNSELRKSYYVNKKYFKKIVKKKLLQEKDNLTKKLVSNENDPKQLWKILNELQKCTHGQVSEKNDILPEVWLEHFKDLMCKNDIDTTIEQKSVSNFISKKENWHIFNELSFHISDKEILTACKGLNNGKASGADMISNEMIKSSIGCMVSLWNKLFNKVIQSGHYPTLWRNSWLKPLHKGGDTKDPNKYRGISIMSCVGKLFCSVLNNRLVKFLEKRGSNSKMQLGFSKKCRTSDHILTLKTLVDKYTQGKNKLYACFIDYQKAFDSVWRNGLLYKLLKNDIGGPFGKIINNLYRNTTVQVKLKDGLTESFKDNVGVRQGCVLSPTLFKVYVNDLPDMFTEECRPVTIYKKSTSCLMFADDIVLLSETKNGLQCAINKLYSYSKMWKLNININKSKVMIFSRAGRYHKENFTLGQESLELVKDYNYLGINLSSNGTFHNAIKTLDNKARKAMFKIRKTINKANVPPKLALRIYDTLVRPIQTYCSEIWGMSVKNILKMFNISDENYKFFDEACFEKTDLKYCKSLLGVHKMSSNPAVRGELGRYPVIIHTIKLAIKNWFRVAKYDQEELLYDTYLCNLQMIHENRKCWLTQICNLVNDTLGCKHVWDNQGSLNNRKQLNDLVNNLKHIFEFQWLNTLNKVSEPGKPGNKLRTYAVFKKSFVYEDYLDFHTDYKKRQLITKLRISAHKLEIEKGRYTRKKAARIEPKDRICKYCDLKTVEDEKHVLLNCPKYSCARNSMFNQINKSFPMFTSYDEKEKFLFLMKCQDLHIYLPLIHMLEQVVKLRGCL